MDKKLKKLSYGKAAMISFLIFILLSIANSFIFKKFSIFVNYHCNLDLYPPLIFMLIFGIIGCFIEKRDRKLSVISILIGILFIILVSIWYVFTSSVIAA